MSGQKLTIDDEELARLIQVGEDSRVEFKEALAGVAPTRIREAICAFANDLAGGGHPAIEFVVEPTHLLATVMAASTHNGEPK